MRNIFWSPLPTSQSFEHLNFMLICMHVQKDSVLKPPHSNIKKKNCKFTFINKLKFLRKFHLFTRKQFMCMCLLTCNLIAMHRPKFCEVLGFFPVEKARVFSCKGGGYGWKRVLFSHIMFHSTVTRWYVTSLDNFPTLHISIYCAFSQSN